MEPRPLSIYCWSFIALCAVVVAGCAESSPPAFRLDMTRMVGNRISPDNQQAIADTLDALFGTPDKPFAMPETGLDQRKLNMAAGPVWGNRPGEKRGLYRRHCAHCHGINGDGNGPTASILNPYPRDYRPGIFKFKSTVLEALPTDEDLRRIVNEGVPGTAMPAFVLYPSDEVNALVEYVKYLSMRGQMEAALVEYVSQDLELGTTLDPARSRAAIAAKLADIVDGWKAVNDSVIIPTPDAVPPENRTPDQIAASVAAGRELFFSAAKGNCMQCHGQTALGDGQQTAYDDWSKVNFDFIAATHDMPGSMAQVRAKMADLTGDAKADAETALVQDQLNYQERLEVIPHLLTPRTAIPRNLRENIFRGGRRPIDLFWRIKAGIRGTPMSGAPASVTEQEIWQIVDYVQSLPYEPASRPQRRPVINVEPVIN